MSFSIYTTSFLKKPFLQISLDQSSLLVHDKANGDSLGKKLSF